MCGVLAGAEGDTELVIQDKNPCVININGQYITPNAAQTVKNFSKLLPIHPHTRRLAQIPHKLSRLKVGARSEARWREAA